MARADVTTLRSATHFEAYQIENEYGRTIETYQASLLMARVLERFSFYAWAGWFGCNLDGLESGVWNQKTRSFELLSPEYSKAITKGMRIALKQAPPDLLRLPMMTQRRQVMRLILGLTMGLLLASSPVGGE